MLMEEINRRDFKGVWIPAEIWLNEDLTLQEKVFFAEIDSLDRHTSGCNASNSYFGKFFNISGNRSSQVILSLEKKGFINIEYVYSKDNKNVIEKRILTIRKRVPNFLGRGTKFSSGGYQENDEDNNTKKNNTKKKKNKQKENFSEAHLKLSNKLSKIIQSKKRIKHTQTQIKQWASEFQKLEKTNKVNLKRQKEILKWYKTAIGGQYIPVIESGKSFREKFTKLEDAKNRESNKPNKLENTYNSGKYKIKSKVLKV